MKNIADVNSDDILTELNNLDYIEEDLKLLDDEDIKPINNKVDDDLEDFYMDYNEKNKKDTNIDLYTEKTKVFDPITVKGENKKEEEVKSQIVEPSKQANVDSYLNRINNNYSKIEEIKTSNQPPIKNVSSSPIINKPTTNSQVEVRSSYNQVQSKDNVDVKDLSQLFNKVSNNVKGASEIVNRNAEIKRKIEEKFDEFRRLQQEHETNKKKDYEEINAYKDEVYSKLQQKKADIEKDLIDLRNNQEKLNTERKDFENYKNSTMANLKKLENDLKASYDSRNKNIEQVELGLVKRKEQLDAERALLAKEKEKLEKEREELTNNLIQFNKLVDDFTNGIDKFE